MRWSRSPATLPAGASPPPRQPGVDDRGLARPDGGRPGAGAAPAPPRHLGRRAARGGRLRRHAGDDRPRDRRAGRARPGPAGRAAGRVQGLPGLDARPALHLPRRPRLRLPAHQRRRLRRGGAGLRTRREPWRAARPAPPRAAPLERARHPERAASPRARSRHPADRRQVEPESRMHRRAYMDYVGVRRYGRTARPAARSASSACSPRRPTTSRCRTFRSCGARSTT